MFSARQALADLALPPFPFEGTDGGTYELPHIKSLSVQSANAALEGDLVGALVGMGADPDVIEQVTALPVAVLEPLLAAWMAHAESKPGESAASSPSIGRTARPSKLTSRSAAGSKTRKR